MKKNQKSDQNNKKSDRLLTIIIGVLLLISVILIVFKIVNGNILKSDDKRVVELHNYFSSEDLGNCEGLFTYADDLVTSKDITKENKLCLAYHKSNVTNEETVVYDKVKDKNKTICVQDGMTFRTDDDSKTCTVTKIDQKNIAKTYQKIYGQNLENVDSFKIDNLHICYSKDGYYYCGLSETFTYTIGKESVVYRVIDRAIEKGSEIVIYDYFTKLNDGLCYNSYTATAQNDKCSKAYEKAKDINAEFMRKYAQKFKHIFKKNSDDTYYWVSSEPVNK